MRKKLRGKTKHLSKHSRNENYVCIFCRRSYRLPSKCKCGRNTYSIGRSSKVPKKNDDKGWNYIAEKLVKRGVLERL